MTTTLGVGSLGQHPLAGQWERAAPSAVVTSPDGAVTSSTATLAFTYSSPVSRAQYSYRYQVRTQDGSTILYDSGTVVSASTSGISIPFLLSDGSSYQIWVQVSDVYDTGDWGTATFSADLADVSDYPDNTQVGSVYEIGINGTGYMLADVPERPYRRSAGVLDPPRFATSETPFSEAVERYTMIGQADWSGGAGQQYLDRERSVGTRYWDSEGINPFDEGLRLVPNVTQTITDTYAIQYAVVAGGRVYVTTALGELSHLDAPGSPSAFTITGAAEVDDMTSDGTYWYYADGANVFRNNSAADPAGAWSTINAYKIEWASDRIAVAYDSSGDAKFSTLADDGTEEVVGGRATHENATITAITSGSGFTFYAVQRSSGCTIMAWQNGSTDAPFVSLVLPAGQSVSALGFYLGNVFIRATEVHASKTNAIIYRAVPVEGRLTAERVVELDDAAIDHSVGDFSGDDRFVYFSWRAMADSGTESGIGCIDLSTGGYAKWMHVEGAGTVNGAVRSIVQWDGITAFTIDGVGLQYEGTDTVASGFVETSISDLASGLDKVVDDIRVTFDPLPSGGDVTVEITVDGGSSYTSVGDATTAGLKLGEWDVATRAGSVGLRITLGQGTLEESPVVRTIQTRVHTLSLSDQILTLPVNCSDRVAGLNGSDLPYRTTGMQRARVLEALLGSRCRLQDIDWPVTRSAQIWEVVGAEYIGRNHTFDQHKNRQVQSGVCVLTLRRGL